MSEFTPGRLCSDGWIKTYLEYTRKQASPRLFHIWTAISVIAGTLRRNVFIDRGGYYTLYPNLYVVLVAPTGKCMKSTAASIGVRMLRKIKGPKIVHEKITPEGLISFLGGELAGQKRLETEFVSKTSVKLKIECNCFIFAPELSVFLGGVSYTAGLIELLTSLYEGKDSWEYRTKTHGEVELHNVNINLFGCSNPEWLAKGFSEDSFGGGFMGRTIYIFQQEGKKEAWPERPKDMEDLEVKLSHDLLKISELRGEYSVTDEAKEFYIKWYNEYSGDFTGRMAGYYERKPDHILKLSMIHSAQRHDTMRIEIEDIKEAIGMLQVVEEQMPQAFAYIGATNEARVSQHIVESIGGSPQKFIAYKRLLSNVRHMIRNRKEFDDMLDLLTTTGQIKCYNTNNTRYFSLDDQIKQWVEAAEILAETVARAELEAMKKEDMQKVAQSSTETPRTLQDVIVDALEKIKEKEQEERK